MQMLGLFWRVFWRFGVQQFAVRIRVKRRAAIVAVIEREVMVVRHDVGQAALAQQGFNFSHAIGVFIFIVE